MAVKLTCPTCATTAEVDEYEVGTAKCPECDDVLVKSKYKAKAGSAKKKAEEDEDDKPARKKPKRRSEDDEEKGFGFNPRDGAAAARIGIPDGFDDPELVRDVEEELSRGEVLHFACRPSVVIAKWQAIGIGLVGILFATVGGSIGASVLLGGGGGSLVGLIPLLFCLVGVAMAVLGPRAVLRQAARGWYAVTDRRAIVFHAPLIGSTGSATTYTPSELGSMRTRKSWFLKDGGDVIFKSVVTVRTEVVHTSRGSRTQTSRSTTHYGFLGVERVKDVEAVLHEVLLVREDDDD